jgi:hypothetical protein
MRVFTVQKSVCCTTYVTQALTKLKDVIRDEINRNHLIHSVPPRPEWHIIRELILRQQCYRMVETVFLALAVLAVALEGRRTNYRFP